MRSRRLAGRTDNRGNNGKRGNATIAVAVALLGTLTLSACTTPQTTPAPTPSATHNLTTEQSPIMNGYNTTRDQALLTMEVLTITPTPMTGYSPAPFQTDPKTLATKAGWQRTGVNNPHCTIPNAALIRDGHNTTTDEDTCTVTEGQWFDPLSGKTSTLEEVEPQEFLPTERVWTSGGSQWSEYQFSIYNTSPDSIMTINKDTYKERSQRGPADWRPKDATLWCGYALRWVSEKNTFGLSMENQKEADALADMLSTCPTAGFAGKVV